MYSFFCVLWWFYIIFLTAQTYQQTFACAKTYPAMKLVLILIWPVPVEFYPHTEPPVNQTRFKGRLKNEWSLEHPYSSRMHSVARADVWAREETRGTTPAHRRHYIISVGPKPCQQGFLFQRPDLSPSASVKGTFCQKARRRGQSV